MHIIINDKNTGNKDVEFIEKPFGGGRELYYDGVRAKQLTKNTFRLSEEQGGEVISVTGTVLSGMTVCFTNTVADLIPPTRWYEKLMTATFALFLLGDVIFGSMIVGIIVGAITGFICLYCMKRTRSIVMKIVVWLLFLVSCAMTYLILDNILKSALAGCAGTEASMLRIFGLI